MKNKKEPILWHDIDASTNISAITAKSDHSENWDDVKQLVSGIGYSNSIILLINYFFKHSSVVQSFQSWKTNYELPIKLKLTMSL